MQHMLDFKVCPHCMNTDLKNKCEHCHCTGFLTHDDKPSSTKLGECKTWISWQEAKKKRSKT